jgi:hypothetical protein
MNSAMPPSAPAPPSDEQLLRLAVQNLACHPQAQRRYVQMGWMSRAVGNLQRVGASLDDLVADGKLEHDQAEDIAELRDLLAQTLERRPDVVGEDRAADRDYLFSDALEDEDWEAIRQRARRLHHALAGESSVFVAIMAK